MAFLYHFDTKIELKYFTIAPIKQRGHKHYKAKCMLEFYREIDIKTMNMYNIATCIYNTACICIDRKGCNGPMQLS